MDFLQRRKTALPPQKTNDTCGLLWEKTSKTGATFFSGLLLINEEFMKRLETAEVDEKGNKKIFICAFDNTEDKKSDTSPDLKLKLSRKND